MKKYIVKSIDDAKRVAAKVKAKLPVNSIDDLVASILNGDHDQNESFNVKINDDDSTKMEINYDAPLTQGPDKYSPVVTNGDEIFDSVEPFINYLGAHDNNDSLKNDLEKIIKHVDVHPDSDYKSLPVEPVRDMCARYNVLPINEPYPNAYVHAVLLSEDIDQIRRGLRIMDEGFKNLGCDIINARFVNASYTEMKLRTLATLLPEEEND